MGLFIKKPDAGANSAPLYTLGLTKTILIVGLGNQGREYVGTRHNIGFECLDVLVKALDFPAWTLKKDLFAEITSHTIGDTRVILLKPTTFMNESGRALQAVQNFYKIPLGQIFVIHDELDIPFGQIRTRNGGSSAGHNGIKSIIKHCGDEFGRIRVGIGNDFSAKADSADFVLGKFTKPEQEDIGALTRETSHIISELIHGGVLNSESRQFKF